MRSGFRTANAGRNMARHTWRCRACGLEHSKRPKVCGCGSREILHFASKKELRRGRWLLLEEHYGHITHLEFQPRFPLIVTAHGLALGGAVADVAYVADFRYHLRDGREVVEDVKGDGAAGDDPVFNLKLRLVEKCYGIKITIVRKV